MEHVYEFTIQKGIISGLVSFLIVTALVYFAARIVIDRSSIIAAAVVALLGSFLATLVWGLIDGIWGLVAAIATWALVAAIFFRASWVKGALIGVVAWLLWFLVNVIMRAING